MKKLISFALKTEQIPLVKLLWKIQSIYYPKDKVWTDDNGNTLAHYACMHHNKDLWNFTKKQKFDLQQLNKEGKAPIHLFIEWSFVQKSNNNFLTDKIFTLFLLFLHNQLKFTNSYIQSYLNKHIKDNPISISFNKEILKDIVASGGNINQFIEYPERTEGGWEATDFGSFSVRHILGSPLELLVSLFWQFTLFPIDRNNNDKIIDEYDNFFYTLTSLGANPNLIFQGNTNSKEIRDAMSSYPSRVVSIFFAKFIVNPKDYYAIRPFLIDSHTDLMALDDAGNSILHTLFARMSARKERLGEEVCEKIIDDILNNKNLTTAALNLPNQYNMTPLLLLRGEAEYLRKKMESFSLQDDLSKTLEQKTPIIKKKSVNKI